MGEDCVNGCVLFWAVVFPLLLVVGGMAMIAAGATCLARDICTSVSHGGLIAILVIGCILTASVIVYMGFLMCTRHGAERVFCGLGFCCMGGRIM